MVFFVLVGKTYSTLVLPKLSIYEGFFCRGGDLGTDPDILKLVQEQTQQWTNMMQKQRKEEWEMLKTHAKSQEEPFKKLATGIQVKQMKDLEASFTR